ncbi:MAG: hypothetical protein CL946_09250 [Ectothiorhodospiraceae bacterium]|nr:hypothetical protein [Ectothiorhodospiraceae bacterium]
MKIITGLLLSIFILAPHVAAQEGVYKFELNKPYKYYIEGKNETTQDAMGQTMNFSSESTAAFEFNFTKQNEDGSYSGTIKIEGVALIRNTPQGMETSGSDLAGKEYTLTLAPTGELLDYDTTIGSLSTTEASMVRQMMGGLPRLNPALIEDEEDWNFEDTDTLGSAESPLMMESESTYEVDGEEDVNGVSCMKIVFNTEGKISGEGSQRGMEFNVIGDSKGSGVILFDKESSVIRKMTNESTMEQVITPTNNPGMKINVTTSGSQTVELLEE